MPTKYLFIFGTNTSFMRAKIVFSFLTMLILGANSLNAQSRNYNRRFNPNACNEPYNNRLFNRDFAALSNTSFRFLDEEIHHYIAFKCLSTEQIRRLAMLYQSDRDKYNFLVYAYSYVMDSENYGITAGTLSNLDTRARYTNFLLRQGVPVPNTYYNGPIVYGNPYSNYPPYNSPYPNNTYPPQGQYNNTAPYAGTNVPYNAYPNGNAPSNTTPQAPYNNNAPQYNAPPANTNTPQGNYNAPSMFMQTVTAMRAAKTEVERLGVGEAAVRKNIFDAQQMAGLMQELPNDDDKLEFAQYAYTYVSDPHNYNACYAVLKYETDKKQLSSYIGKHQR